MPCKNNIYALFLGGGALRFNSQALLAFFKKQKCFLFLFVFSNLLFIFVTSHILVSRVGQ